MNFFPRWQIAGSLLSLEILKLTGFLLMLLDHSNRFLSFPGAEWAQQAGRLCFPIFALVLGMGLQPGQPAGRRGTFLRLLGWATIAQACILPLIVVGAHAPELNVIFTLAAGVALVHGVELVERREWWRGGAIMFAAFVFSEYAEFGVMGALLVWAGWRGRWVPVLGVLGVLAVLQASIVPMFTPVAFFAASAMFGAERWRAPRMLFGVAYAAHFAVLSVVVLWLSRAGA
jgi:hypothetical protein